MTRWTDASARQEQVRSSITTRKPPGYSNTRSAAVAHLRLDEAARPGGRLRLGTAARAHQAPDGGVELAERYEGAVDDEAGTPGLSVQCNDAFHAAVVAASGSSRLQTLLDVISSVPLVSQALGRHADDRRRSVLQHRDILTAIAHHDEELAESAVRSHILAARYTALHVASVSDEPRG